MRGGIRTLMILFGTLDLGCCNLNKSLPQQLEIQRQAAQLTKFLCGHKKILSSISHIKGQKNFATLLSRSDY